MSELALAFSVGALNKHYNGLRAERIIDWLRQALGEKRPVLNDETDQFHSKSVVVKRSASKPQKKLEPLSEISLLSDKLSMQQEAQIDREFRVCYLALELSMRLDNT